MPVPFAYKNALQLSVALLLLAVAAGVYFEQPWVMLLPAGAVVLLLLLLHPEWLLYSLLFFIPWSAEFTFAWGWSTDLPDEPLMLLMAFSAVSLILYRSRWGRWGTKLHPLIWLLLLHFTWTIITVVLSTHFILSVKFLLAKSWYLLAFVAAPYLLWTSEKIFKRSVVVLFFSMVLVTLVTVMRHGLLGFSFATINPALVPFFRNHVTYSSLLVFMVPVSILLLRRSNKKHKNFYIFLLLLLMAALYLSFARGAWLALILGAASYLLLKKKLLVPAFVFAFATTLVATGWLVQNNRYVAYAHDYNSTIFHQNFSEHLAATYQLKDLSTAERFHRWVAAVRMSAERWPTGFGPTTFYQHYKSYTVPAFKTWVSRNEERSTVHNYFLLLLVEQGVLGLLLFLALLAGMFILSQRIYHRTSHPLWKGTAAVVAVILTMQCTVNFLSDLIETDKVGSVFYLCVAALIVADRQSRPYQKKEENTKAV